MKVLIIEDDPDTVEFVSLVFKVGWPEVKLVSSHLGAKGVELVETESPDIVILDLGLPDISGFEVLRQIRLFSSVPILVLTVRAEETDIVKALELGTDEYIAKPFRQLELLARIRALQRRQYPPDKTSLICGPWHFDPSKHKLCSGEKVINLTHTESNILLHLVRNTGKVVTHASLADVVWGTDYPGAADALRVYVRRLRKKIETNAGYPQLILTKVGTGYYLAKTD